MADGRRIGIIIGVNEARWKPDLPLLFGTQDAATNLANILRSEGFHFNIPDSNVFLGHDATTGRIKKTILAALQQFTQDDTLLISFSGYAMSFKSHILLVTADYEDIPLGVTRRSEIFGIAQRLSIGWLLREVLRYRGPGKIVLVLDCVFSDPIITADHLDFQAELDRFLNRPKMKVASSRAVLFSVSSFSEVEQLSSDTPFWEALRFGLLQSAVTRRENGTVTVDTLHRYLRHQLGRRLGYIRYGSENRPITLSDIASSTEPAQDHPVEMNHSINDESGQIGMPSIKRIFGKRERRVNVVIYHADDAPDLVLSTESLILGGDYRLQIDLGRRKSTSRLPRNAPALPEPPIDKSGLDLFVSVTTRGNVVHFMAPTQVLHLPQRGNSAPITFNFRTLQLSPDTPIWVHIYYNWVLLQTIEIHVAVTSLVQNDVVALPAHVIYSRSDGFTDLEALRPSEVSLIIGQDNGSYRLTVAWPGDGTGGHRDPARGLAATLPINANDLASIVLEVRNLLYNLTWLPTYRIGQQGKLADRRESLYQLAVAGNRLYSLLFTPPAGTTEQADALAAVRQWLTTLMTRSDDGILPVIQIVHHDMSLGIPWGLMYPAIVNSPDDVNADLFWGCSYRLEILTPQLAQNAKTVPADRNTLTIVGGTHPFRVCGENGVIEVTADHRKAISSLQGPLPITVDLREQADKATLHELLRTGDVIYMFCHGHTAKMPDDSSDWVARFRDQMAKLTPELREKYADLFKLVHDNYQPDDPYINDSWLKWTNSLLPLSKLTQWDLRLPRKPLVVLNMCESAQVLPTLTTGFIPFFSRLGARGVIGTECPMVASFAAAFGQQLLERLACGEVIGDILPALRRQFIEDDRNPLGLAYTYYGDIDLAFGVMTNIYTVEDLNAAAAQVMLTPWEVKGS